MSELQAQASEDGLLRSRIATYIALKPHAVFDVKSIASELKQDALKGRLLGSSCSLIGALSVSG